MEVKISYIFINPNSSKKYRLTNADNLSYKEILEKKGSNFKKMRFNEQTRRAWDSIINSAYSSSQSCIVNNFKDFY